MKRIVWQGLFPGGERLAKELGILSSVIVEAVMTQWETCCEDVPLAFCVYFVTSLAAL